MPTHLLFFYKDCWSKKKLACLPNLQYNMALKFNENWQDNMTTWQHAVSWCIWWLRLCSDIYCLPLPGLHQAIIMSTYCHSLGPVHFFFFFFFSWGGGGGGAKIFGLSCLDHKSIPQISFFQPCQRGGGHVQSFRVHTHQHFLFCYSCISVGLHDPTTLRSD